jgi:peptide deformylase
MAINEFRITGLVIFTALSFLTSCQNKGFGHFTEDEKNLIHDADSIMRVLTITDPADSVILRATSTDLSAEALLSADFERLTELMVATVTHPSQDGVGIAGPQVGINRRVVAVQRFDKEPIEWDGRTDHPFEVYPNVRIVWASDSLAAGPEGCLSVPDRRGDGKRSQKIVIEYADIDGCAQIETLETIPMVRDTIKGFTAVIFQHEIDHLDGVLYIDRL